MQPRRVTILGGGITGLAAASHLRREAQARRAAVEVTVIERAPAAGGCIQTAHERGFIEELGPDSLVTSKPWAIDLIRRVGLENDLIGIEPGGRASVVRDGKLVQIPGDFTFFTPTSIVSLAKSGLFSLSGMTRAAAELIVPAKTSDTDETLASFVGRRFGREVLDRLAQPLVGGVYSGDAQRLSMRATMPQFMEYERRYGSVIRATRKMREEREATASVSGKRPTFVTLKDGLGSLIATLGRELDGTIRANTEVASVRREGSAWVITCADGTTIDADAVICALPTHAAARVIGRAHQTLSGLLATITYHSIATVNLAYDATALVDAPASTYGFVVPHAEGRSITAATIVTRKYAGRAPAGSVLVRAFVGGAMRPELVGLSDDDLLHDVCRELFDLLNIREAPRFSRIQRCIQQMPEYAVGHVDLVDRIEREAGSLAGFALAGAGYRGAGIPDCVRSGEKAAENVLAQLTSN